MSICRCPALLLAYSVVEVAKGVFAKMNGYILSPSLIPVITLCPVNENDFQSSFPSSRTPALRSAEGSSLLTLR